MDYRRALRVESLPLAPARRAMANQGLTTQGGFISAQPRRSIRPSNFRLCPPISAPDSSPRNRAHLFGLLSVRHFTEDKRLQLTQARKLGGVPNFAWQRLGSCPDRSPNMSRNGSSTFVMSRDSSRTPKPRGSSDFQLGTSAFFQGNRRSTTPISKFSTIYGRFSPACPPFLQKNG